MGPCAKTTVRCVLINMLTDEVVAVGENVCMTPQETCPRVGDEGYEKCKTVCNQVGHAEEVAAYLIRNNNQPLISYITGHTNYCQNCESILRKVGVVKFRIGKTV